MTNQHDPDNKDCHLNWSNDGTIVSPVCTCKPDECEHCDDTGCPECDPDYLNPDNWKAVDDDMGSFVRKVNRAINGKPDELSTEYMSAPRHGEVIAPNGETVNSAAECTRLAERIAELESALREIADQPIDDESIECGDVENGYRVLVLMAKQALKG